MMNNFREAYETLLEQKPGTQRKIEVFSCLSVFLGVSHDGHLRLSFMSQGDSPKIESTQIINIIQGREDSTTYWTSFDLLDIELKDAFISFCENLIETVAGINDEIKALRLLKRRFATWKILFQKKKEIDLPKERVVGLFGELYTLKNVLAPIYGPENSIKGWGGPDMQSKDFTINETWYEVKTIGANTDKVHISSLTQLSSSTIGHLVVVRAEAVSPEFGGDSISLIDVIKDILLNIADEVIESLFTRKLQEIGINIYGNEVSNRFDVKSIDIYQVDDHFPRITEKEVPYPEITSVTYALSVAAINKYKET